jgi:hypothetical protein
MVTHHLRRISQTDDFYSTDMIPTITTGIEVSLIEASTGTGHHRPNLQNLNLLLLEREVSGFPFDE